VKHEQQRDEKPDQEGAQAGQAFPSNRRRFRLKDIKPGDTLEFTSENKPRAKEALAMGVDLLSRI